MKSKNKVIIVKEIIKEKRKEQMKKLYESTGREKKEVEKEKKEVEKEE